MNDGCGCSEEKEANLVNASYLSSTLLGRRKSKFRFFREKIMNIVWYIDWKPFAAEEHYDVDSVL